MAKVAYLYCDADHPWAGYQGGGVNWNILADEATRGIDWVTVIERASTGQPPVMSTTSVDTTTTSPTQHPTPTQTSNPTQSTLQTTTEKVGPTTSTEHFKIDWEDHLKDHDKSM